MANSDSQKIYTTGKVAKICGCSIQNIIRCINKKIIPGYNLPGSTHRRVFANDLYNYMIRNNIPTNNFPEKDIPKGLETLTKTEK